MAGLRRPFGPFLHSAIVLAGLVLLGMVGLRWWPAGLAIWERRVLAKQLRHTSPTVRWQAARDLISEHGPAAAAILLEAIDDPREEVRILVCSRLGWVRPVPREAIEALVRALADSSPAVRQAACESLGHSAQSPTLNRPGVDRKAVISALRFALADREHRARLAAAEALARFGRGAWDAVPELTRALDDTSWTYGFAAARSLLRIDRKSNPIALQTLSTLALRQDAPSLSSRMQVVKTLREANPEAAAQLVPSFLGWLQGSNPTLRDHAVWCLNALGPRADFALPALEVLLNHPDLAVRFRAAQAIWALDTAAGHRALATLRSQAADPSVPSPVREGLRSMIQRLATMMPGA